MVSYFEIASVALIRAAAEELGVTTDVVKARRGPTRIAHARQAVWYVLHARTHATYGALGALTGHEHTSVYHGLMMVARRLQEHDEDTQEMVVALRRALPADTGEDGRRTEAMSLLETCEALAGNVEAIGHSLAAAGERLAALCVEIRASLAVSDRIERGAA